MKLIFDHDRATILHGDSAALDLPENSVDALVFDPPAAISFMGQAWDDDRGGYDGWTRWLAAQLASAFRALKPGGHALAWALPRTSHWTARALELAGFEIRDVHHDALALDGAVAALIASLDDAQRTALARCLEGASAPIFYQVFGQGFPKSLTSASAEIPNGTGTALKPAVEHWILARKPLGGRTVAECVREFGTGVLQVDACRIAGAMDGSWAPANRPNGDRGFYAPGAEVLRAAAGGAKNDAGRWPAHLSLDESAAAELDAQSGTRQSGTRQSGTRKGMGYHGAAGDGGPAIKGSSGGASRFFYVAKPARSEKDAGLGHLVPTTGGEATGRADGTAGVANPRAGAGRTGGARNAHPTVKSIALMRWLIRLITPPGGVVLDPFAGSGTTGVAAIAEGRLFVGVEQGGPDGKYIPILVGRIRHALDLPAEPFPPPARSV